MADRPESQSHKPEEGSIAVLNDFVLFQIFNRMDKSDLCSVVDVNHQFKRVSMMAFSGRFATQHFCQLSRDFCVDQMRRIICKFGHLIKSLELRDIIGNRIHPIKLEAISKYCAGTMEELKLILRLDLNCDDTVKPLFSSLKTLTINYGLGGLGGFKGNVKELFSSCRELKTLRVYNVPYDDSAFDIVQKYTNLEELCIGVSHDISAKFTFALLRMNQQIKKLDITDDIANQTIYAVASQMNDLEELVLRHIRIRSTYDNVSELAGLKSLKVLELHDTAPDFVAAVKAIKNVPLDSFKWFDCESDLQFIKHIIEIKTLKTLALTDIASPFDNCLVKLGEQLPLLDEVELGFKHQEQQLFSIGCLIDFVKKSTTLNAFVLHTIHSELFNQQFYDSLFEVIQRRSRSNVFQVTIHGNGLTSSQTESNLLQVKLVESECECNFCLNRGNNVDDNYIDYDDLYSLDDIDEYFNEDFDEEFDEDD